MSRISNQILTAAIRAPFWKRFGLQTTVANTVGSVPAPSTWSFDNTFEQRWRNAANTDDVRAVNVDSDNKTYVAEALTTGERKTVTFTMDTAAGVATQAFFIADRAYRLVGISEVHRVAGSDAAAVTGSVEKTTGTIVPGSGTTMMSGTFNFKGTANTVQNATLSTTNTGDSDNPDLLLAVGDRLSVVVTGVTTALRGVQITIVLAPGGSGKSIVYNVAANADIVQTNSFFVANRPYVVTGAYWVHSTPRGATLTAQLYKDPSGTAGGAGTALLTNNTNVGFDVNAAANTVQTGALVATAGSVNLAAGDKLTIKYSSGTLTNVAGAVLVVILQEQSAARKEVSFYLDHVPGATDLVGIVGASFFTADREYEVLEIRENHRVLGTDASAVTVNVTSETGTTAPGSGTALLTDNSNAGFSVKATINTTQVGTLLTPGAATSRFLLVGDRLSTKVAGVFTAAAGMVITVSLAPR